MKTKIQKTILAGIIGTAVMTLIMIIASMVGMPKMSPPKMLAGVAEMPIFVGWIMHFMIGVIFAFVYTYVCIFKWKIKNVFLKGVVFGIIVFIIAQVIMAVMSEMIPTPSPAEGEMTPMIISSLIAHIIFGIVVAKTVGNAYCSGSCCSNKK